MVCIFRERDVVCMRVCYLSELSQGSFKHGCFTPVKTPALNKKAGAHRASDPVTKATAVKPNVDRTKLGLKKRKKKNQEGDGERQSSQWKKHWDGKRNKQSMQSSSRITYITFSTSLYIIYIYIHHVDLDSVELTYLNEKKKNYQCFFLSFLGGAFTLAV